MEMKRYQLPVYKIPRERHWWTVKESELKQLEIEDPAKYEDWDNYIYQYQQAPIRTFLPHGVPNASLDKNDGRSFLNDWHNDLILMTAPNQTGKTTIGITFCILHGLIPTDPSWECFTQHGIEYHEWTGPKILIAASYSWDNTTDLADKYMAWLPRAEIPRYAPYWGAFEGEKFAQRELTFGNKVAKELRLTCGSKIIFLCYTQNLSHWEGKQCDIAHMDEQCPEDKLDALTVRQLTRGAYTPIIMTLTGHTIPGRPDTGASGWIKTKVIDKGVRKGRKFREYKISIKSTPTAIMTKEAKERAYQQWVVEPVKNNDFRKQREAEARYWGGWQTGGGLIISEWTPTIHIIEPFDINKFKPTFYRMIDHGQEPCAALLIAKFSWGDMVAFREYYYYGRSIAENCKSIVEELSENRRVLQDEWIEEGRTWQAYAEDQCKMQFASSELDGVSWGQHTSESKRTIGTLYNQFGCTCSPANAQKDKILLPLMKELFALDRDRKHINTMLGREVPEDARKFGSPRFYTFSICTNLIREIAGYAENPKTGKAAPNTPDHLVCCVKQLGARERLYLGSYRT